MINFDHGTELKKNIFRLVRCVRRRRNSESSRGKYWKIFRHNHHGWTQKRVTELKGDKVMKKFSCPNIVSPAEMM